MSWLAPAAGIACAAIGVAITASAIRRLLRAPLSNRPQPPQHAEHVAAQNGRPNGSHVVVAPIHPPPEDHLA